MTGFVTGFVTCFLTGFPAVLVTGFMAVLVIVLVVVLVTVLVTDVLTGLSPGSGGSCLDMRDTSLIRHSTPLEPYSRTMPRALWWSQGGPSFL